jgi:hypothetical protein
MADHRRSPPPRVPSDLHMPTYCAAGTALFSLSSLCAKPFVPTFSQGFNFYM